MATLPPLAETMAQGGRAGSVATTEEGFSMNFKAPSKANPEGLTPEHLFGAAWAACFNGAVSHVAKKSGHADAGIKVTARVQLHPEGPQPFSVELLVRIPDLDEKQAQQVLAKAHAMCAYSKATHGNVKVKLTLA
jgi:lipoyl-dependent peroxiredoxin